MIDTPIRNRAFFGRESILRTLDDFSLSSELTKFPSELSTSEYVVLCGMGGLGKNSFAIEFAFSRRDRFDAYLLDLCRRVSKVRPRYVLA
jgi:hypothetical protein